MKYTEKEFNQIRKYHPAITTGNSQNCGGYQTVLREINKYDMTITSTCNQCGATKETTLECE